MCRPAANSLEHILPRVRPCSARRLFAALALLCGAVSGVRAEPAALRVCLADDSAPYSSTASGTPRGFDHALFQAVALRLGRRFEPLWFESRYDKEGNLSLDARALLAARLCDFVAGMPLYAPQLAPMIAEKARAPDHFGARPLRQRPWQTLVPVAAGGAYRATALVLVARAADAQQLQRLDALAGRRVAVRAGSMASLALAAWHGGALAATIQGHNLREDVLAAVESGAADAALVDLALWDRHRAARPETALARAPYAHPVQINIGVLARASDAAALAALDAALAAELAAGHAAALAEAEGATGLPPVQPTVRATLTLRDFATAAPER